MIAFDRAFSQSWNRLRKRLFDSFSAGKWLRLGFAAWLASFVGGGGSSAFLVSFPGDFARIENSLPSMDPRIVAGLVICGLLAAGLALVAMFWVGSRAQFQFLDNVVRDRAAVAEPWRRFREQGNDFFRVYTALVSVPVVLFMLWLFAVMLSCFPELVRLEFPGWKPLLPWLAGLAALIPFWIAWSIAMFFYRSFGVPVMAASGCSAREAIGRVWAVLRGRPGDCALYFLISLAIGVFLELAASAVALATCCVGGLPYVNTVLLLPVWVFRQSFTLDCLEELAPEYRLWIEEPPSLPVLSA